MNANPFQGFHRRVKAKTIFQDDDVSIDDTTTKPLFTPPEKGHKGFHRRVKAKTSLQDDDVPIDDTTTKPLFTPQEKRRKEDADYQRILWRPSPEEPVVDYRLLTVTYGTTSAPFLAMRTLQQLAEDEGQNYPEASRVTLNDFYVDDLLTGAQTIAETKELIDQLKDLMKKGGFHLRKWNSNCHEIVSHVEEINEERKINLEKGAISKILGIVWDHVQDTFRVNITIPEEVVTKRDLLSNIARIFDPIGFLSPTTVAMANLQRQTAVKEVEDLEGLPVYHRAILKENGEWPEVTKAIQCSYPKVFVGDGTHLYLLIEDVESLDGPNVRSVLCQYHIPHKKWIWRKVNGFAPIVISKSIVYASHDKRVYFVGGRIHSRGNKDWVRAVFVHAGKESKYLWKLNLKSKQWTELPTYVKYRDRQYTAVALDLVFILGPADKEHETAEKYLSFFKTRRCELPKFGLLPESTYDLLRSWLRFPSNLNQGSAAGGIVVMVGVNQDVVVAIKRSLLDEIPTAQNPDRDEMPTDQNPDRDEIPTDQNPNTDSNDLGPCQFSARLRQLLDMTICSDTLTLKLRGVLLSKRYCLKRSDCCLPPVYFLEDSTKILVEGSITSVSCFAPAFLHCDAVAPYVAMAAALQKIDMDPEQQLHIPKIVDIAAAVIEMYGDI
ncbi:hypothetical protein LAZ67_8002429 [Cordylochernes scorpioides]|uniref:Uncharacterized protein n=1 Tax=Cordylochernes scorpioides TaxID=51811 RepID=A0ABY6KQX6_9ARAC|nr:hypothetical protein LAZ67_8002429 [Cordylochernes scorpioides]